MATLEGTWQTSDVACDPSKTDHLPAVFDSSGSSDSQNVACLNLFLRVQQSPVREDLRLVTKELEEEVLVGRRGEDQSPDLCPQRLKLLRMDRGRGVRLERHLPV